MKMNHNAFVIFALMVLSLLPLGCELELDRPLEGGVTSKDRVSYVGSWLLRQEEDRSLVRVVPSPHGADCVRVAVLDFGNEVSPSTLDATLFQGKLSRYAGRTYLSLRTVPNFGPKLDFSKRYGAPFMPIHVTTDRKSTRLNSSHYS